MSPKTSPKKKIALFDSGVGGLTVLRELLQRIPDADYFYLGDTARVPYGTKCRETIVRYSRECSAFLSQFNPDLLVIACNTSSAAATEEVRAAVSCPVIETVNSAVKEVFASDRSVGDVLVLGTEATVLSGAYTTALHQHDSKLRVHAQPCPLFVPLVENGLVSGEIVEGIAELYLGNVEAEATSHVILGCTHYPLLAPTIKKFFPASTCLIECSKAIAAEAVALFGVDGMNSAPAGSDIRFFVTDGVDRFKKLTELFLGAERVGSRIEKVTL